MLTLLPFDCGQETSQLVNSPATTCCVRFQTGEKSKVSIEAFLEWWSKRLYPLGPNRQYHRLLCHAGSRTEAITMTSLQPFIEDALAALPQLSVGTELPDQKTRERVATVLAQRIMHFCCRTSVRRMSRLDFDSSDLEDVLELLAQGGDVSPSGTRNDHSIGRSFSPPGTLMLMVGPVCGADLWAGQGHRVLRDG